MSLSDPSFGGYAVTPSDSVSLERVGKGFPRGIYVGTSGNVAVDFGDGTAVVFANVPSGTTLPIRVKLVKDTSTTASNIVALY